LDDCSSEFLKSYFEKQLLMWIVMPTASLKAKYLSQKLLLMKKSEECFIGNCIYPAKLFIKNLFAKGSYKNSIRNC